MSEGGVSPDQRVSIEHPESTCLLGLLMKDLLTRNLSDDRLYGRVRNLQADIQVGAGDMVVTLRFKDGTLTIAEGSSASANARVAGGFAAMLGVVTGDGGMVGPLLSGDIEIGGNPFLLLKILPLIKTT